MRGKRGFPGTGAVVAGTVACGVLATPGVAFATPPPSPPPSPTPRPVQSSAQTSAGGGSGRPAAGNPTAGSSVAGSSVAESHASGGPVAGGSSSLSAYPSLGHFGVAVGRPLRGRITLANPTGGRLAFRVVDPTLLPAGITLDADGLLGGASRVSGTWTVPVEACVPSGGCATGTVTITITCECARSLPPSPSLTGAPCSAGDVVTE
ncbi:hypothetical protein [Streptosporangium vulgare]|uniref:Choice-of-anchor D domain-containing protein n=1 Tax=Streptosporangium vulgare TaxID=46190 RepID=A0ABV5T7L5_9ACTN